jgi:hypothetical protein
MTEAKDHPHAVARDAFIEINGVTQPVSYPHRERERQREGMHTHRELIA